MFVEKLKKRYLLVALIAAFTLSLAAAFIVSNSRPQQTVYAEATGVKGVNLTLSDDLIVKIHTDVSSDDGGMLIVDFCGNVTKLTDNYNGTFCYVGVAPKNFADQMTVKLLSADGETQIGEEKTFSVRSYLESLLQMDYSISGSQTQLKFSAMQELAVDLLNYGAAAQIYSDYKTDDLADKNLTAEQKALASAPKATESPLTLVNGNDWVGAGVRFDTKLGLYFVFAAESVDGVTATVNDEQVEIEDYPLDGVQGGRIIRYNGFNAINMNEPVTARLFGLGEGEQSLTYSVASYVMAKNDLSENATEEQKNLAKLVNATYAYGYSAVAYAAEYVETAPTFEADGGIQMNTRGYDYSGTPYAPIVLPKLSLEDYDTITLGSTDQSGRATTTFYLKNDFIDYSLDVRSEGYIFIADRNYSRYEAELISGEAQVEFDEQKGFTYRAFTPQTFNGLLYSRGKPLTLIGDITLNKGNVDLKVYDEVNVGTDEETASVTVDGSTANVISMYAGAGLNVAENSTLTLLGSGSYGIVSYGAGGVCCQVDGRLLSRHTLRFEGAAASGADYDYGFIPGLYVRKGTVTIEDGVLMTNCLQVGSLKYGYRGKLNISQSQVYQYYYGAASYKGQNTILAERFGLTRFYFVNGDITLNNSSSTALTCIDERIENKSSAITILEGAKFKVTGNYAYFIGAWNGASTNAYKYHLDVHSDAQFDLNIQNDFMIMGSPTTKPSSYIFFSTATLNIDGVEKTVYCTDGWTEIQKPLISKSVLTDNEYGTKSMPKFTPVQGEYVTQGEEYIGYQLHFMKATYVDENNVEHVVYYHEI